MSMLEDLRDLLTTDRENEAPEPERVRKAITETEENLADARSRLERLREAHGDVLLTGTDERIERHEAKIEQAERDVARLEAARERLDDRLEEAEEAAETRRAVERADEALALKQEGEELLEEWRTLVERACEILPRLDEIESQVESRRHAFRRSPEHDYSEGTPPLRAASLGIRNPNPVDEVVLPPAGPDSPRWNATTWQKSRERSYGDSSGPEVNSGSMVKDSDTGQPTTGGVGQDEARFLAPTGEKT